MKKMLVIISVALCAVMPLQHEGNAQERENAKLFDVRVYLEKNHVISLYHEWINRERPEVVWSVVQANTAIKEEDAAWKEIRTAVRAIRQIKKDEMGIVIKASCLACRSALSSDELAVQCRAAEEIERLCVEIQKRLIEYPEQYEDVPIDDIVALTTFTELLGYKARVAQLESRMSEEKKTVEAEALTKRHATSSSEPSKPVMKEPVDKNISAHPDRDDTIDVLMRGAETSIESLFARAAFAMGTQESETIDVVAIQLRTELPLLQGKHDEAILLARIVMARASAASLVAIWEMCKSTGSVPSNRADFLAAAKKVRASACNRLKNFPDLCTSSERLYRFALQGIALSQKSLRMPNVTSMPTSARS